MKTKNHRILSLITLLAILSLACLVSSKKDPAAKPGSDDPTSAEVSLSNDLLYQWSSGAKASSEYSDSDWAASQATGKPNVETCEDSIFAWASASAEGEDWIELTYDTPVYPTAVNIHTSFNPFQVVKVQVIDTNNKAYTVIEGKPEYVDTCPDIFEISMEIKNQVLVDRVKIFVDQSVLGLGWNEIDAVELVGYPARGAVAQVAPQAEPPKKPVAAGEEPAAKPQEVPPSAASKAPTPYLAADLAPGTFAYDISGYETDSITEGDIQYQSTTNGYVIGFANPGWRYTVSLFLPKEGLKSGLTTLVPYDVTKAAKPWTAAIYINAFLYIAEGGEINIQNDPSTGKITGTFYFKAQSKDFPDRAVDVAGAFNEVELK